MDENTHAFVGPIVEHRAQWRADRGGEHVGNGRTGDETWMNLDADRVSPVLADLQMNVVLGADGRQHRERELIVPVPQLLGDELNETPWVS